jgi:simple sugar transport system ATP-binding protein
VWRVSDTILALNKATKLYAGVPAIDGVDFDLKREEIHALVGENGAGKSTLTKVMAGVVTLTSGTMILNGVEVSPKSPLEARRLGIGMVFQENSLVPTMTVAQNLFLGQERFYNRLRGIYIAAQQFLQSLNFDVAPTVTVGALGAAKKQMVEIARAVLHRAKVIIFDEPTASLTPEEKKYFFDLMRDLQKRGVSRRCCSLTASPCCATAKRSSPTTRRNSTARALSKPWSGETCRRVSTACVRRPCARLASAC